MFNKRMRKLGNEIKKVENEIKELKNELKKQDFIRTCVNKTYMLTNTCTFVGNIYFINGLEIVKTSDDVYYLHTDNSNYNIRVIKVGIESEYDFVTVLTIERENNG